MEIKSKKARVRVPTDQEHRRHVRESKLQNSWADKIHQCMCAKPKDDKDAALLEYLDRAGFTPDQLRLIILGALGTGSYDSGYADGHRDALRDVSDAISRLG
ncbi:hypothetical protein FBQ95_17010 [Chloroflexi bacterium CFX3]|nr:hypothetical protein [Chloroflexi bacterium CFX3]